MAVLQRTPHLVIEQNIQNIRAIYDFKKFDRQLAELDACLSPGGIFVLEYTQYQFKHASVAPRYEHYDFGYHPDETTRRFKPDGTLDPAAPLDQVAFIKR